MPDVMIAKIITNHNPNASAIRCAMLVWYDKNRRDLPWRSDFTTIPNPYHVWLSEVMLQQTTVQTVIPYFLKFISLWPDIRSLAAATQEDILREWAGLGYYSRARNLHKCALVIVNHHDGQFPKDASLLKSLPGIGDYTTAAIQSIAFDIPATVIDGNIERIISRLHVIETPLPFSKPVIRDYAKFLFEGKNLDRPSCFAQSLMDLGATICTPKSPKCPVCPVQQWCEAYKVSAVNAYPKRKKKIPIPQKHAYAFLYMDYTNKCVLVKRREEKGMLAGMMGFPTGEWISVDKILPEIEGKILQHLQVKHVFTHFSLTLIPVIRTMNRDEHGEWITFDDVEKIGLPTLFTKLWKSIKVNTV